mmetsp:Transcript_12933/g.23263  ORF Transcript_12933/g.23263 Transcript_12933/m.23263 type:complete len:440 (-) Transcript_12933:752-2071(-)|eukprot:CAMPEP_0182450880 /NCGR_PEP_ID=MMETSP1172-20130603/43415_1 /TAXON_ID=708627 /ORGANISM="Timspurckia oligopyrenoides, Strain CCMP3278" /LENGTH=439 /DNA_ID=CAMNT_0024648603 /DNA_START=65 /DNA_END=1384 /DNA_ORIENTATION=+
MGEPAAESKPEEEMVCLSCPFCEFVSNVHSDLELHVESHLQQMDISASEDMARRVQNGDANGNTQASGWIRDSILPQAFDKDARLATALNGATNPDLSTDSAIASQIAMLDLQEQEINGEVVYAGSSMMQDTIETVYTNLMTDVAQAFQRQSSMNGSIPKTKATKSPSKREFHVCSELDHFEISLFGHGWACGYTNIQTMLSCLIRDTAVKKHLETKHGLSEVPTLPEVQARIESAWKSGYDSESEAQLGQLFGQTKWIGAMEVAALLRSLGIRALVIDFEIGNDLGSRRKMVEWIFSYFQSRCIGTKGFLSKPGACEICRLRDPRGKKSRFIPPLFLQHPGHSRTVIGAEKSETGDITLLILDPSKKSTDGIRGKTGLEKIRKGLDSEELREPRYQIVYIGQNSLYSSQAEQEAAKHIGSEIVTTGLEESKIKLPIRF